MKATIGFQLEPRRRTTVIKISISIYQNWADLSNERLATNQEGRTLESYWAHHLQVLQVDLLTATRGRSVATCTDSPFSSFFITG